MAGRLRPLPDLFAVAAALAAAGDFHRSHKPDVYDASFELRPSWLAGLEAQVTVLVGRSEAEAVVRMIKE